MTKYGSADVGFVLVGGYNLLGVSTEISDTSEVGIEDTTALGDAWEESTVTGVGRLELTQAGFFDDATGSSNEAFAGQGGLARVVAFAYEGNTLGKKFVGFQGPFQAAYTRVAKGKELHKANATYRGSGALGNGRILKPLEAVGAANSTELTPYDSGASSANGGAAYFVVNALSLAGYDNIIQRLRHSADNVTYATLVNSAAVTVAPNAQRVTASGTVERYLAMAWAYTGAGGARTATIFTGFVRNP